MTLMVIIFPWLYTYPRTHQVVHSKNKQDFNENVNKQTHQQKAQTIKTEDYLMQNWISEQI